MKKEKVVGISLGLILIIFVMIMTLSFTSAQGYKSTTTSSNSYNKYTYNTYSNYPTLNYNYKTSQAFKRYPTSNYNYQRKTYKNYPTLNYNYRTSQTFKRYPTNTYNYQKNTYNYLKYTSTGNYERYYGVFGNEINEYNVYVRNRERKGGYFTTKFYLTDYYGKTRSESVTHYLKPNEERRFVYKNVYSDGREYKYGNYKIVSHTRY